MAKKVQVSRRQPSTTRRPPIRESVAKTLPTLSPWVVAGVLLLLTLVFHSSILFGDHHLWEDFVEQEFPFRNLAASSLAHGILPQWDPYIFAGMPFMADIQAGFWYPTNLLQTLFVSNNHLTAGVMEWFILLHYWVAGLGMFYFVRKVVKLDDWSSLLAGVAYAFSGFIVAQAIHQMIVYHIALFPWVGYFFVRGLSSWKYTLFAGLTLGVMYLAGHPQSTLYLTFALGVLASYELVLRAKKRDGDALTFGVVLRAALPVLIGLGIFAIQLMPSNELADLSRREVMTYEKSVDGSISFGNLLTLVVPRLFGVTNGAHDATVPFWNGPYYLSWETAIYVGILPLFLGLAACLAVRKQRYLVLFAGLALFAVCFAFGDHFFLYRIFFALPFFNKLRTPARMMMVFAFSMSVLGGIGLSRALKSEFDDKKNLLFGLAGLLIALWLIPFLGIVNARTFLATAAPEADQSISWGAGLAAFPVLASAGILILLALNKIKGSALALAAIGVTVIELFIYGMGLNAANESPVDIYNQQPQLVETIRNDQAKEISRARTRMGKSMLLERNDGAYDRIQLIEGYNPLVLQRVSPEMKNQEAQADLMNIKWSIVPHGDQPDFAPRPSYLPRAKMYYKVDVRPDSLAREVLKTDSLYDYRNTLLIEEKPSIDISASDPSNTVRITNYSEDEIAVKVRTATNGMLWLSEVYYPAWKAYVDGKPTKIHRAFTSLRAIEVPAGEHSIVLRYESSAFRTGSMITLATLLLTLAGLVTLGIRTRKPSESPAVGSETVET